MKRCLFTLGVLLAVGGILNVAVAWVIAIAVPIVTTPSETNMTCNEVEGWAVKRWRRPGLEFVQSMRSTLLAPNPPTHMGIPKRGNPAELLPRHGSFVPDPAYVSGKRDSDDRAISTSGWPFLTLWCDYELYGGMLMAVSGGIETPIKEPDYTDYYPGFRRQWPRALPLRPLWVGFAANTFFYAAALWLTLIAPFALRRWRRIKRNLCPACAYPIGTSPVCTECGQPVRIQPHT